MRGSPWNLDNLDRLGTSELMRSWPDLGYQLMGVQDALRKRHADLVAYEPGGGYARISQQILSPSSCLSSPFLSSPLLTFDYDDPRHLSIQLQ